MAPAGLSISGLPAMPIEPVEKRTVVFIDGQNLYHCAREAFARRHPDYDVYKLARSVCHQRNWLLTQVRFYTGYPSQKYDPLWGPFWQRKLLALKRQGVWTFARELRYRKKQFQLPDGSEIYRMIGEEKGIDVRIAIDIIRLAFEKRYDVGLLLSQDQDLSEATDEVRRIGTEQARWIKLACAFPIAPHTRNRRGVEKTDWIHIDQQTYESCVDPTDYRGQRN